MVGSTLDDSTAVVGSVDVPLGASPRFVCFGFGSSFDEEGIDIKEEKNLSSSSHIYHDSSQFTHDINSNLIEL